MTFKEKHELAMKQAKINDAKNAALATTAPAINTSPIKSTGGQRLNTSLSYNQTPAQKAPTSNYKVASPARRSTNDISTEIGTVENIIKNAENTLAGNTVRPFTAEYDNLNEIIRTNKRRLSDLKAEYYYTENEGVLDNLSQNKDLSDLYETTKGTKSDVDMLTAILQDRLSPTGNFNISDYKSQIASKYGILDNATTPIAREDYYADIEKLRNELSAGVESNKNQLSGSDINYDRLVGYEQILADAAEDAVKQREYALEANRNPVLASAKTVIAAPLQGFEFIGTAARNLRNIGKGYKDYVPVTGSNMDITNYVSATREAVSKEIERTTDWELFGQNVASFLYNTGMSMADSATQIAMFGPAATYLMGASAASSSAKEILDRGGSGEQAFWGGLAAGAAEAIFEKFSVDNLLKSKDVKTVRNIIGETLKQAGIEASEEINTELANILFDNVVMGDKSQFNLAVSAYVQQGLSEEEAKKQATLDTLGQIGWAGVGGFLSGGGMGGVVNLGNYAATKANNADFDSAVLQMMRGNVAEIEDSLVSNFGKTGQEIYRTNKPTDGNTTEYYADFARVYHAGLTGTAKPTSRLTASQANAAYKAGKIDASATQVETKGKVESAVAYKGGFDMEDSATADYVNANLSAADRSSIDQISKALGVKVRFADQVLGGNANADISNGVITIEKNNPNPVRFLVGHEITHRLQELAPTEYSALRKQVAKAMTSRSGSAITASVMATQMNYEGYDMSIGDEAAIDEAVADYVGELLQNEGELERFIALNRENKTLLERFLDIVRDIVSAIKGDTAAVQLRSVERRLSKALGVASEQASVNATKSTAQESGDETKNSLKSFEDGRRFVDVDIDQKQFDGLSIAEMNALARSVIKSKFAGSVVGIDNTVFVNGRSAGKYVYFPHGTENEVIEAKARASTELDNLIDAGTNFRTKEDGEDGHVHPDVVNGFSYFDTTFKVGDQYYLGIINIKNNGKGRLFYGVTKTKNITEDIYGSYGENPTTKFLRDVSMKRIPQKPDAVNISREVERKIANSKPVDATSEHKSSLKYDKQYMDAAIASNIRNGLVDKALMTRAAEARQAVADIFNDPELAESLGLPPDVIGNTYIPNGSYSGTEENTTVCIRSIAADALMDAVAEHLGRPLTVEDTIAISQEYWKFTDKPECLYCYVAMDRKAHREFLGSYLEQRDDVLNNIHNGMDHEEAYQKFLNGRKDTKPMRDRFNLWLKNDGKAMVTANDLASMANVEKALERDPSLKPQINDALKYAQSASWAKKRIGYAAYNNHILKWKQARINSLNSNYGLRMYSFSDFSPAFILENMQMITDASVRGLKVLAYTKELDFVKIFAGSGMNINISVFGYDDGNGGVAMDAMQGADWAEAQELRTKYANVGCTFVATNDAQVNWALDQDWIDVIIPFHMVRTGTKVANYFGWKNYTAMSADTKKASFDKAKSVRHILPPVHQNDKATYLKACEDNHLVPRFNDWVDHPNYMKLVNETRQSEGNTKPVQPIFDVKAAKAAIADMRKRGGYYTPIGGNEENMRYIAGEIAESINENRKLSLKDKDYMKAVNAGDMEAAQKMVDEAAKAAGYRYEAYHGTNAMFNVFSRDLLGSKNFMAESATKGFFASASKETAENYTGLNDADWLSMMLNSESRTEIERLKAKYGYDEAVNRREANREKFEKKWKTEHGYDETVGKVVDALMKQKEFWVDSFKSEEKFNEFLEHVKSTAEYDWNGKVIDKETGMNNISQMHNDFESSEYAEEVKKLDEKIFAEWSDFEIKRKGYTPNIKHLYVKLDNPFVYDFKKQGRDISFSELMDIAKERKCDGCIFKNVQDGADFDTIYTVFDNAQFKSADPVTYDDNGNVIPLSERFNPANNDIRFSLKDSGSVAREIARIQKEGVANKRSDADIQAEIRNVVETAYANMIEEYGSFDAGETPAREVRVPKKTGKNEKVSQTVRTILEAKATPDEVMPDIERLVADGTFSYEAYGDEQAVKDAEATVKDKGFATAYSDWAADVRKGKVNKANTTLGWVLYNNAVNTGDVKTSLDILTLMIGQQRNAAQALQATRILKKLSPETQLYSVQRSVANLQRDLVKKYGNKAPSLKVNDALAENLLNAETETEKARAMTAIYNDIGRQMPSRFIDKWNAWRYLAMLGNLRTHIRNVVGNAAFAPVTMVKNVFATGIEYGAYMASGGKLNRTKGMPTRDLLEAAWGDYVNVRSEIMGEGKYSDSNFANKAIEDGRQIFKNKALEAARKGNSALLDMEDSWFSQPHYANALAQYCKANGITAQQIRSGKNMDAARAYAIKEAQKATYRDTNVFSEFVSKVGKYRGDNKVGKTASVLVEGILPFRKTPANILARGVEYSPIGLLKSVTYDLAQVKKGNMTGAEMIDNLSAGLTGTGLLALGLWLASQGVVRGAGEGDEEEKKFAELQGHQEYALELDDGTSVTLDWLAPEALPFFIGVNIVEQIKTNKGKLDMASILSAVSNISEPMLEMSCLQSLNDVLDAVGGVASKDVSALVSIMASAATSYLTQGIPTLLGQAERSTQEERMTTYTGKSKWLTNNMQYLLGSASSKIPVWDFNQIPYIDAWGRTENAGGAAQRAANNFLNPAYTSKVDSSKMEQELERLYKATTNSGVLPDRAAKYFNVDKERKDLTAEEYVKYATEKGQMSYDIVTELVGNEAYKQADDTDKAEMVSLSYEYANAVAKTTVSNYKLDGWVKKASETTKKYKISPAKYIAIKGSVSNIDGLKDKNGDTLDNSKSLLIMQEIYSIKGLTDAQRNALFADFGVGKTVAHYNKALVDQKLEALKKKAK